MIYQDIQLDFRDVLIKPRYSTINSRSEVNLVQEIKFEYSKYTVTGTGIIASNMTGVGTISMAKALAKHHCFTALHKHYDVDTLVDFFKNDSDSQFALYSMGITEKDASKFEEVLSKVGYWNGSTGIKMVRLDVANGYMVSFVKFCNEFRKKHPDLIIMAGNVVSSEQTRMLISHGKVDVVFVGIGQGSCCTTRKITGVGRPQFSAVLDCVDATEDMGIRNGICSDGGCTNPGDVAKAFCAGARFVCLGGMLAGTNESETEIDENGKLKFFGMSSKDAMHQYSGGVASYRSSEGKTVSLEPRGAVDDIILEILGGLRSTGAYIGHDKLSNFCHGVDFYKVNSQLNEVFGKS